MDGVRIYHPGDTDKIPEMKKIKSDIVFMPLGQTYTMNSLDDAIEVVMDIKPELAIPFHYGIYEGSKEDADKFKQALSSDVNILILACK